MNFLALSLGYSAFLLLCLAMNKHHRQVYGAEPSVQRRNALRTAGVLMLLLSLATAMQGEGWKVGLVIWIALLAVSGLAVAMLLPQAPRTGLRLGWAAPAVAGLRLLLS